MKIIFMGSAAFATASLKALTKSSHEILEVVAQPDKPAGRGMQITVCPVATFAKENNLPLFQPKNIKKPEVVERFRVSAPDLIVVVAYGKILPPELIEIPAHGCVNVHASLLPKYRGAAPINWAIINGETETGVTTQLMNEELDAGDIFISSKTPIGISETASELHDRLSPVGAGLLMETIAGIENGSLTPTPQDNQKVTYAPILKKEDGLIYWSNSSSSIYNRIRGLNPWPGTYAKLDGKILRIHKAEAAPGKHDAEPGTIIEAQKKLAIACGDGTLYLLEVQLEGKRRMSAVDFLRGHKIEAGNKLT